MDDRNQEQDLHAQDLDFELESEQYLPDLDPKAFFQALNQALMLEKSHPQAEAA